MDDLLQKLKPNSIIKDNLAKKQILCWMTDVHNKETRSLNMSRIRNKDTKHELIVRRFLHSQGFRYRVQLKTLPGKPDIVFPKQKIAIFMNGCYFHGHKDCPKATTSKTQEKFWKDKIALNMLRDKKNEAKLNELGWNVITLWECEIEPRKKKSQIREMTLENLKSRIKKISSKDDTCN